MKYLVKPISRLFVLLAVATASTFAQDPIRPTQGGEGKAGIQGPSGSNVVITAPTQTNATGTTFDAVFQISDVNGFGIISYQGTIHYTNTVLQFNSCSVVGTISGSGGMLCNIQAPGQISFVWNHTQPLVNDGDGPPSALFKVSFTAIGANGTSSPLTIPDIQVMEFAVPAVVTPGLITIGGSTAADTTVSGRVLNQAGRPISRAMVVLQGDSGVVKTAMTGPFGYFQFQDVTVGQTYVLKASAKKYTFAPRILSVDDQLLDLAIISDQ